MEVWLADTVEFGVAVVAVAVAGVIAAGVADDAVEVSVDAVGVEVDVASGDAATFGCGTANSLHWSAVRVLLTLTLK